MIYLDNAATTFPKPHEVKREILRCLEEYCGNPGRASHPVSSRAAEAVFDVRSEICGFFGSRREENVIFTKNATEALCLAIFGILRPRGRIITTNLEHNSVRRPLEILRRGGAAVDTVDATKSDDRLVGEISRTVTPETQAVVCLHASNVCPRVLPIERIGELCRRRGILFIVDASQSAGIYDIDISSVGADVICFPGHKGLFGPMGTGAALFREGFDFARLSPLIQGGTGVNSAEADAGKTPPESFEAGTLAVPSIVGLGEGVRFIKKLGTKNVRAHESSLYRLAKSGLLSLGAHIYGDFSDGSVLSFNMPNICGSEVAARLGEKGICVRAGLHCAPTAHKALGTGGDAVRISFSPMNSEKDVAALIGALREIP